MHHMQDHGKLSQTFMIITPRTAKKEGIGKPRSRVFWQLCTIIQQGALLLKIQGFSNRYYSSSQNGPNHSKSSYLETGVS